MVTPTKNFAQCPCSIQTLYCDNRSPSHHDYFIMWHDQSYFQTAKLWLKSRLLIYARLLLTTTDIVFLVFSFQAELAQNKINMDLSSYDFMTKKIRFSLGGGSGNEKNRPCLYPALHQTVTCSWNVDEWIRERYRDCYVIRTFNNG